MPWEARSAMEEKYRFVLECVEPGANVTQICREFGISRSTGNKWLKRYRDEGFSGLEEHSRRPKNSPLETSADMVCEIVNLRLAKPSRGAEKISHVLKSRFKERTPSVRTINRILERSGLVEKRKKRRQSSSKEETLDFTKAQASNDVWTTDYKGWWRTKDGTRCEPLTIRDEYSRFLLDIGAFERIRWEAAKERFVRCFELYGLPKIIKTDNGVPFCSPRAICGLSRLSAWWIKLGIELERIPRGKPQYNGGHERMHRDMAQELERSPARDIYSQQKVINEWVYDFNYQRPHSALKNKTPSAVYKASRVAYDPREPEYEYPAAYDVRKVDSKGFAWWKNKRLPVSKALRGEHIAFERIDDENLNIWFCDLLIAKTDVKFRTPLTPIGVNLNGRALRY